jgi:hypothetical protein
MDDPGNTKTGMERLVETYRVQFQIEENVNYYSQEDYRAAERKYLKYVLETGRVESD